MEKHLLSISSLVFWLLGALNTYNVVLSSLSYIAAIISGAIASIYYVRKNFYLKKQLNQNKNNENTIK